MENLLTEPEVAERLRCSISKVYRLRKTGHLPYIPGRPILVSEADLIAYVERSTCRHPISSKPTTENGTSTGPTVDVAAVSALARRISLRRRYVQK